MWPYREGILPVCAGVYARQWRVMDGAMPPAHPTPCALPYRTAEHTFPPASLSFSPPRDVPGQHAWTTFLWEWVKVAPPTTPPDAVRWTMKMSEGQWYSVYFSSCAYNVRRVRRIIEMPRSKCEGKTAGGSIFWLEKIKRRNSNVENWRRHTIWRTGGRWLMTWATVNDNDVQ